jgi:hypothetical protein
MLPRVAFEYGQTMCALCTSLGQVAREARQVNLQLDLDAEAGRDSPMPTWPSMRVSAGSDLRLAGDELQCAPMKQAE